MYHYSFEKLEVWQLSRKLVGIIYKITDKFLVEERVGLTNQLRRAAVSINSNIAEDSSRSYLKDQIRFIEITYNQINKSTNQQITKSTKGRTENAAYPSYPYSRWHETLFHVRFSRVAITPL